MASRVTIEIADADLAALDEAVLAGRYADRDAALRDALAEVLHREHVRAAASEYQRAYREQPQDTQLGEVAAVLFAEAHRPL